MGLKITVVDAFTEKPFAGNPAAICVLPEPKAESWMQIVAREMNLSETAFLVRENDGFRLRWFTPAVEVDLCGHATLASSHALWEEGHLRPDQEARFYTRSGLLTAQKKGDWIELNFPEEAPEPADAPAELKGLRVEPKTVERNRLDYIVEVNSEEEIRNCRPDFGILKPLGARGVMITSKANAGSKFDFVSRYFAPGAGIDEDPVTGSAHCCLGPYWQKRLGKSEFLAYQASARGGVIKVRVAGNRVFLGGQAATVLRGELL
ncbi:MAG: oxidoreductase [Acidobacteria bacterium]|nr:MAG: oxidoreductase [Acidobacteriota bacterium]